MRRLTLATLLVAALALSGCLTSTPRVAERGAGDDPIASLAESYFSLTAKKPTPRFGANREDPDHLLASGSGFFIRRDGLALTAAHVAVREGMKITVKTSRGVVYDGETLVVDPSQDIALVRVRGVSPKRIAVPSTQACLSVGSRVIMLGRSKLEGDVIRVGAVSRARVRVNARYSRTGRKPPSQGDSYGYADAIEVISTARRGESGGPTFDERGRLIGMTLSILSDEQGRFVDRAHVLSANRAAKFVCSRAPEACSDAWRRAAQAKECPLG